MDVNTTLYLNINGVRFMGKKHIVHFWKALVHANQNMAKFFFFKLSANIFQIFFFKINSTGLFGISNFCKHVDAKTLQIWAILAKAFQFIFMFLLVTGFFKKLNHISIEWLVVINTNCCKKLCKFGQSFRKCFQLIFSCFFWWQTFQKGIA